MPNSIFVAAAIATIVTTVIAVAQLCWRAWRRVAEKRKRR